MQNLCFGPECTISGTEVVKHPFYSIRTKMMFRIVSEHFVNIRRVKRCKTCVSGLNALFWATEVAKHPFYCIGPKMMFGSVSDHFANVRHVKDAKPVFRAWMQYFGVPSCKASSLLHWTQNDFGVVLEHFDNLRYVKRCKTCASGRNALFWGTEVVKHPFYSSGPKMMFGIVSEHFANLRHVKRCKTCVLGLNALFCGPEVVKHPFYSTRPRMMFGSVSEHFANLQHVKDAKLAFRARMHYSGVPKL
jgi:acid stress-induced BolA-like protein IbaG/YrbA